MLYLFPMYLVFIFFVLFYKFRYKSGNVVWFVLLPIGFCLAFLGLVLFTEYVSFANFRDNPLFKGDLDFIWKLNYYLNLSLFGMYRLMNIGIALYLIGTVCYPLSLLPERKWFRIGCVFSWVFMFFLLFDDPALLQNLFKPYSVYAGMRAIRVSINIYNNILNWVIKIFLLFSILAFYWIMRKIPSPLSKRYRLIFIGLIPIHALVFLLFFWFPNHTIHVWRFSTLKFVNLPSNNLLYSFIVVISIVSLFIMGYAVIAYNIFEINTKRRRIDFLLKMNTAGSGIRVFSHAIKNQFIALKLLAEQIKRDVIQSPKDNKVGLGDRASRIIDICERSIEKLGTLPAIPNKRDMNNDVIGIHSVIRSIVEEYPSVEFIDPEQTYCVYADEYFLREALRNIIMNSVEAVKNVSGKRIVISAEKKFSYILITLEDNGAGIPKNEIKRIFEPFHSTKPSITNWGLGLTYSLQVIEAFGGLVDVSSREGEFTRFELFIPEVKS